MFSSSEVCEEVEDGSTSLTPESAGLGGNEPEIGRQTLDLKASAFTQFEGKLLSFSFEGIRLDEI